MWQHGGTAYTRTCNHIRLGFIDTKRRPVWLEAYAKTPPLDNPSYNSQEYEIKDVTFQKTELYDQKIIYEEDKFRAVYQENYGNGGQIYDFTNVKGRVEGSTSDNQVEEVDDPSTFKSLPIHPLEKLAQEVRSDHTNLVESLNLITPHPKNKYQKVENFLDIKKIIEERAPEDDRKTNLIQDLDIKASMQPKPVGRMFGNIYGAEIKDWPMY